jgi:hypothetical protein
MTDVWVDREVARLPEFSAALLDLRMLGGRSDGDVLELLRILAPELPLQSADFSSATDALDAKVLAPTACAGSLSFAAR